MHIKNCVFKPATLHVLNRTQYEQIVNSKVSYENGTAIIEFEQAKNFGISKIKEIIKEMNNNELW